MLTTIEQEVVKEIWYPLADNDNWFSMECLVESPRFQEQVRSFMLTDHVTGPTIKIIDRVLWKHVLTPEGKMKALTSPSQVIRDRAKHLILKYPPIKAI